jgi:hypothetical protein
MLSFENSNKFDHTYNKVKPFEPLKYYKWYELDPGDLIPPKGLKPIGPNYDFCKFIVMNKKIVDRCLVCGGKGRVYNHAHRYAVALDGPMDCTAC